MKDDIYLQELQTLFQKFKDRVSTNISRQQKYSDLKNWIIAKTPKLNSINSTLSTRIYWILSGINDFPKCKTCGKPLMMNASVVRGYVIQHCSNSCAQLDPEIKDHKRQTCLDKYGVEYAWQADIVKQHIEDSLMDHYGVKHPLASLEVQKKYQATNLKLYGVTQHIVADSVIEKTRNTNLKNYGVDNPWKLKEIQDKCRQKYCFENICFDSAPEIAFFIWLRDNKIDFVYQPNVFFEYYVHGKTWKYYPDFQVKDLLYEIKGDHFFKDGKMICPYRDKTWSDEQYLLECSKYEAKHQCMLKNGVVILTSKDYAKYINYVESIYGKDFLKQLKNQSLDG